MSFNKKLQYELNAPTFIQKQPSSRYLESFFLWKLGRAVLSEFPEWKPKSLRKEGELIAAEGRYHKLFTYQSRI